MTRIATTYTRFVAMVVTSVACARRVSASLLPDRALTWDELTSPAPEWDAPIAVLERAFPQRQYVPRVEVSD
jgi:hypothetical protein